MKDFDIDEINLDDLQNMKNLLKDKFDMMVNVFFEDAEKYFNEINEGYQEQDLTKISKNAHPLKSSSATLGFTSVSKISKYIEESISEGKEISDIKHCFDLLKNSIDFAKKKIQQL